MSNRQCRKSCSRLINPISEYQTRWAFTGNYDHGNHHLARATIRPADPGLVTGVGLTALGLPDADAPIIDELAQASGPNLIVSVLADAALLDLDRYATGRGLRYSRVGTTLMLAVPSDQRLAEAIDTVAAAAIGADARLTGLTTQYIDEEKALASIGVDPWITRPSDEPTGQANRILYVGRDGARIHVKAGRVLVDAPGSLPSTSLPKNSVTRVVLFGNVSLSADARSWAMRSGVEVVCLSRRGSYQGALVGANRGVHASRLLEQVALTGDRERRVRQAASLIGAKIRSQIRVLTRIARRDETVHVADTTAHMHAWRRSLAGVRTLDEIMGIEGACSSAYFDTLAACMPADVTFDGRSRRPPRDLPNAALSYGCAILLSECVGALHAAGLEPSLGVAHAPTDKRPSLALDLMEQFRLLLVNQTVRALLRTRKLRPEHGVVEAEAGGVGSPGDDLHHRLRHRRQQTAPPRRQNTGILGLSHTRILIPTPPRHPHARARAFVAGHPHFRGRRRHPHLPHLLILRRPRRHTRHSHSAGRCGVESGSVVRG